MSPPTVRLAIAALAAAAAMCQSSCTTQAPAHAGWVPMKATESLEFGLDSYVLLPREVLHDNPPGEQAKRNYQALLDQVNAPIVLPAGVTPREIHKLHLPVLPPEPGKPLSLADVDVTTSRIYLDALTCLLPLYPVLRERLSSRPGPFLVTTSPGLNTLAFRNRYLTGGASAETLRKQDTQLSMDWMVITDLSQASPEDVRAAIVAYQDRLDLSQYYDRELKMITLVERATRAAPALQDDAHMLIAQPLAFMPGMAPGQGCSPYTEVLVSSGAVGYFKRADFLAEKGYMQEAVADLDRAIALQPGYPAAYRKRAMAHYYLGHYQEAVADISIYIASHPDSATAFCNRALAHAQLRAFEPSQRDADECRRLGGLDETFIEALKRLQTRSGAPP